MWGVQNTQNTDNNNGAKVNNKSTMMTMAGLSNTMIAEPSLEFQQRVILQRPMQFSHPPTPQIYHNMLSPCENPDQSNFSPRACNVFARNQHINQLNNSKQIQNRKNEYQESICLHPNEMKNQEPQLVTSNSVYGQPLHQPNPVSSPNQRQWIFTCNSTVKFNEDCNSTHTETKSVPVADLFQKFYIKDYQNDNMKINNLRTHLNPQMSPLCEIPGMPTSNPDMKPHNHAYESPASSQITSTQPTKRKRPKIHNCSICMKGFTSIGHLKRHYNTAGHKNEVKSSSQPDSATLPMSNQLRHTSSEDQRSMKEAVQSPYVSQNFVDTHNNITTTTSHRNFQQSNLCNKYNNILYNDNYPNNSLQQKFQPVSTENLNDNTIPDGTKTFSHGYQLDEGVLSVLSQNYTKGCNISHTTQNQSSGYQIPHSKVYGSFGVFSTEYYTHNNLEIPKQDGYSCQQSVYNQSGYFS